MDSVIGEGIGSIIGASVEALEELEKDYKIVRFGKIVVTGTVRNIVTAMIGLYYCSRKQNLMEKLVRTYRLFS